MFIAIEPRENKLLIESNGIIIALSFNDKGEIGRMIRYLRVIATSMEDTGKPYDSKIMRMLNEATDTVSTISIENIEYSPECFVEKPGMGRELETCRWAHDFYLFLKHVEDTNMEEGEHGDY